MISSTKPSRPTKAEKVPAWVTSEVSWRAHCSRRFEAFIGLIDFYADDLEDAVQIVVVEEADLHRAFSFAIAEQNFGAETLLKFGLKFADVNVRREGRLGGQAGVVRRCAGRLLVAFVDQFFRFANARAVADDLFRELFLGIEIG